MTSLNNPSTPNEQLDRWYKEVTNALQISAELFISKRKRNFFKFWWNAELDELKEKAIKSCRAWREAGKPRCGPLNDNYRKDKLLYKKRLNEESCLLYTSPSPRD